MISPTPTSATPEWPSFGQHQQQQQQQQASNGNWAQASSFIPSTTSPSPMPERSWGPTGLGGEALHHNNGRRANTFADPIGSRPGSRVDEHGASASSATSPFEGQGQRAHGDILQASGSQRPRASAAAAVAAAASSAAARSRATSPSNTSAYFDMGTPGSGFMNFGSSSFLSDSQRMNSPGVASFVPSTGMASMKDHNQLAAHRSPARAHTETPALVVGNAEGASDPWRETEEKQSTVDAWSVHLDSSDMRSPSADSMTASFSAMMGKPSDSFSFASNASAAPPKPFRSNTDSSLLSNPTSRSASGRSMQTSYLATPNSAGASTSSLPPQNSGLLSPSAAATTSNPISSTAATLGSNSMSNSQASLPFQPLGHPGVSAFGQQSGGAFVPQPIQLLPENHTQAVTELDGQLRMSPIIAEMMERMQRHENSVRELHHTIQMLNRNVSLLLERTKHMPPQNLGHYQNRGMTTPQPTHQGHGGMSSSNPEEMRALTAQLNLLSATVSQLMAKSGLQTPGAPGGPIAPQPQVPLSGLGLGQGAGQGGLNSNASTPQMASMGGSYQGAPVGVVQGMQPFAGAVVPGSRFGSGNAGEASMRQPVGVHANNERSARLSPRPGVHSPNPNGRRRREMTSANGTEAPVMTGAMQPPDPSVIVTKWEHLNLHADLLRSILRYGLGPPNKIQQRALPFLLRGSDIIAQAPPTQERIASYIIPVLQLVLNVTRGEAPLPPSMGVRGPMALVISTTVDQATQAQRMAMGLGASLGIRVHIAAAAGLDVAQDATALIQTQPQIVVGTPQKMMDLFNYLANKTKGAISLDDIRIAVLDEVDQLIARNLADHVSTLLRILPSPRVIQAGQQLGGTVSPGVPASSSSGSLAGSGGLPAEPTPGSVNVTTTDRQTAIFSNTVPQDVLNFAQSIHLRESVRVLVRREGGGGTITQSSLTASGSSQGGASSQPSAVGGEKSAGLPTQPVNALGATPANNHTDPLSDPVLASLRGLRQYYLYVAVTTGAGPTATSASQAAHAIEMKLDVITDMLEDIDFGQAVIYTGSASSQEAVTYKLASKGIEALSMSRDMASSTRQTVLSRYRSSGPSGAGVNYQAMGQAVVGGPGGTSGIAQRKKALIVHDLVVQPRDVHQVPLVVFYDLPRSVDEYKDKIACAASGGANNRPAVCVNVVTGSGGPRGDIEMLRTLECHLGCKMAELPMNPGQILQF